MDAPTISERIALRVYRAAPLSLGSAGAWTPIPWDAETIKNGVAHENDVDPEKITSLLTGLYAVHASITLNGAFALTATELRVTVDGAEVAHVYGPAISLGSILTLPPASGMPTIAEGSIVVVEARAVGVGGIDVEPGEGVTFCEFLKL